MEGTSLYQANRFHVILVMLYMDPAWIIGYILQFPPQS